MKIIYERVFSIALDYAAETLARQDFAASQIAQFDTADIERQLLSATREIKAAINASANVIIEKLESDKHEELIGRIQNIALASESTTGPRYFAVSWICGSRLDTLKTEQEKEKTSGSQRLSWVRQPSLPLLAFVLPIPRMRRLICTKFLKQAKYSFLDEVVPNLLANKGKIEWDRLAGFVNSHDRGIQVANLLRIDAITQVDKVPEEGEDIIACDAWWPGYVPDDHELRVYTVTKRVGEVLASDATIVVFEFEGGYFEKTSGRGESHLMKLYVKDGSYVQKGEKIARVKRNT